MKDLREEAGKVVLPHKVIINDRKNGSLTGVSDVLSFDIHEVVLETSQGMLVVKGEDLHVNRLNLEKGEVDLDGTIDSLTYSSRMLKSFGAFNKLDGQRACFYVTLRGLPETFDTLKVEPFICVDGQEVLTGASITYYGIPS